MVFSMTKDKSIFIKNIYYMLSYAFTALNQGDYENLAKEDFENIHNLFAAILAKGIGRQLKQGLYREYLSRGETISVVRGKIDMPGTVRNRLAKKKMLTCEFDELSENNLLNQILKTTVMLLLRHYLSSCLNLVISLSSCSVLTRLFSSSSCCLPASWRARCMRVDRMAEYCCT